MLKVITGKLSDATKESLHKIIKVNELKDISNYFEITNGYNPTKIYMDLDGETTFETEEKFNATQALLANKLKSLADVSVTTSSAYNCKGTDKKGAEITFQKLSFGLTFYKEYCATATDMKSVVLTEKYALLSDLLQGIIELSEKKEKNKLIVDTSVYRMGWGKMRCANAYKETYQPERINVLIKGTRKQTIKCVQENELDELTLKVPPETVKTSAKTKTPRAKKTLNPETKTKVDEEEKEKYSELLKLFSEEELKTMHYTVWVKIGMALYNENTELLGVYDSFSKRDKDLYSDEEVVKNGTVLKRTTIKK